MTSTGCVVFDLDDTLFLERDYVRSGFRAVSERLEQTHGIGGFFDRAWAEFVEGARGDVFDRALAACGTDPDPELVTSLVEAYRAHIPDIALLPDAKAQLYRLNEVGELAVVTDGPALSQRSKAKALGIERWFSLVLFTSELGPGFGKPDPRSFTMVESATGCTGRSCAYVGDNPTKDFAGPRSLGWTTVRVRRPSSLHEATPSGPDVDYEVLDLCDLGGLLAGGVSR